MVAERIRREPGKERLDLWLPLDVAALPGTRRAVRQFLARRDLSSGFTDDVLLCLQEACKNAIRYSRSRDGIKVRLVLGPETLCVIVRDFGIGMIWRRTSEDLLAEHGRGLLIIGRLMDDVSIAVGDGTELRMSKALPEARAERPRRAM